MRRCDTWRALFTSVQCVTHSWTCVLLNTPACTLDCVTHSWTCVLLNTPACTLDCVTHSWTCVLLNTPACTLDCVTHSWTCVLLNTPACTLDCVTHSWTCVLLNTPACTLDCVTHSWTCVLLNTPACTLDCVTPARHVSSSTPVPARQTAHHCFHVRHVTTPDATWHVSHTRKLHVVYISPVLHAYRMPLSYYALALRHVRHASVHGVTNYCAAPASLV